MPACCGRSWISGGSPEALGPAGSPGSALTVWPGMPRGSAMMKALRASPSERALVVLHQMASPGGGRGAHEGGAFCRVPQAQVCREGPAGESWGVRGGRLLAGPLGGGSLVGGPKTSRPDHRGMKLPGTIPAPAIPTVTQRGQHQPTPEPKAAHQPPPQLPHPPCHPLRPEAHGCGAASLPAPPVLPQAPPVLMPSRSVPRLQWEAGGRRGESRGQVESGRQAGRAGGELWGRGAQSTEGKDQKLLQGPPLPLPTLTHPSCRSRSWPRPPPEPPAAARASNGRPPAAARRAGSAAENTQKRPVGSGRPGSRLRGGGVVHRPGPEKWCREEGALLARGRHVSCAPGALRQDLPLDSWAKPKAEWRAGGRTTLEPWGCPRGAAGRGLP